MGIVRMVLAFFRALIVVNDPDSALRVVFASKSPQVLGDIGLESAIVLRAFMGNDSVERDDLPDISGSEGIPELRALCAIHLLSA